VHFSRCGAQNDGDSRYCSACGASLTRVSEAPSERRSLWQRIARLIGTTRKARFATAATATAIAIAIAAFIALPAHDDKEIPYDAYTRAADKACVQEKQQIVASQPRAPKGNLAGFARYADALVVIVGNWRSSLKDTHAPPDRLTEVQALDAALQEVQVEAGGLARVARKGGRKAIVAQSRRVDSATTRVEDAIGALGLLRCSHLAVGVGTLLRH